MEFRPVTAQDVRELAAREYPLGAPPGVESLLLDYAANADGRWAPTWESLQVELATLMAVIEELLSSESALVAGGGSDLENFVQGMESAASWTLGLQPTPPLSSRSQAPVCDAVIAENLAEAAKVIAGLPMNRWFAEGVQAWLLWITGERPGIRYPLS